MWGNFRFLTWSDLEGSHGDAAKHQLCTPASRNTNIFWRQGSWEQLGSLGWKFSNNPARDRLKKTQRDFSVQGDSKKTSPSATARMQGQALGQNLPLQVCPGKLEPLAGWNSQSSQARGTQEYPGQCKGVKHTTPWDQENVGRESRNSPPPYSQIKGLEDFREKALSPSRNQLENDAHQTQSSDKGALQMGLKHKPRQVFSFSLWSTKRSP